MPLLARQWNPRFPSCANVRAAVDSWEYAPWDGGEGPRPILQVGPGVVSIRYRDLSKQQRSAERAQRRSVVDLELRAALGFPGDPPDAKPSREIREWSRKSRARMRESFAGLDWSPIQLVPWPPALLTLTLPGDWLAVAPNGAAFKKLVRKFEKRWLRAWGFEPIWLWKMEFQRRGAPHFHMFAVLPPPSVRAGDHRRLTPEEAESLGLDIKTRNRPAVGDGLAFRQWLSAVWTDVVAHPDPDERDKHLRAGTGVDYGRAAKLRDPARMSAYFAKHSSFADKEYQNVVPPEWQGAGDGPGRFWGAKGLRKAVRGATIEQEPAVWAQRFLRGLHRSRKLTRDVVVPRYRNGEKWESKYPEIIGLAGAQFWHDHRPRYRKVRRRASSPFDKGFGGFMTVNDGPAVAQQLSRAVEIAARPADRRAGRLPWVARTAAPTWGTFDERELRKLDRMRRKLAEFRLFHPTYEPVYLVRRGVVEPKRCEQLSLLGDAPLLVSVVDVPTTEPPAFPSVLMPRISDHDPDRDALLSAVRDFTTPPNHLR